MKELLYVGAGSALGGISRFLIGKAITSISAYSFPIGTLFINVVGSLVMGYIVGVAAKGATPASYILFLTTGLCGGFTTFSAFSMENIIMLRNGQYGLALTYIVASVVLGLLACLLGYQLGK